VAVAGAKPKADRTQIRHRNPPAHEWTEVPNVPFLDAPPLPPRDETSSTADGRPLGVPALAWPISTERWWKAVSTMPHAKLWTEADWEYAMATAEAHARFAEGWRGCAAGTELRNREKLLGMTMDARRDLRIRYVDPPTASTGPAADVVKLDDYRAL
jgi:hypothetical protein